MNVQVAPLALGLKQRMVELLLWGLMAVSSIVMIEPAPFDLIAVAIIVLLFAVGLKVPAALGLPALLMSVFVVANVVSIIFAAPGAAQSLPGMVFYAALTIYLVVLWLVLTSVIAMDPGHIMKALWGGYVAAAVIAVTLAMAGYFRVVPGYEELMMMGRAKAAFKDANVYGAFLIPVAFYLLTDVKGRSAAAIAVRMGLFLFIAFGLLIAFSRGAWGNFLVTALVFVALHFCNARSVREYFRIAMIAVSVVLATAILLMIAISNPRIGSMLEHRASLVQPYDVATGGRFSTQLAALKIIGERPIGIGPNRTYVELGHAPHNVFIKIAAENGWLGGLTFILFVGLTLWRGFWFALRPTPVQRSFVVAYASTVGIVAESFLIDTMHWRHFFVLMAMVWGSIMAYERIAPPRVHPRSAV